MCVSAVVAGLDAVRDGRQVEQTEDGRCQGTDDADADEPGRAAGERGAVVRGVGSDVEDEAGEPSPDRDGHQDRVERVPYGPARAVRGRFTWYAGVVMALLLRCDPGASRAAHTSRSAT